MSSFSVERGNADGDAGQIDAFVFAELAAVDDFADDVAAVDLVDAQLDEAVGEQNARALLNVFSEGLEGGADERGGALDFARGDGDLFAGDEHDRLVIDELGGADLGTLQIAEDTERLVLFAGDFADHLDQGELVFVGAVREIETSHVEAGANELAKDGLRVRGRTEGRHNLCAPLQDGIVKAEISGGHYKFSN